MSPNPLASAPATPSGPSASLTQAALSALESAYGAKLPATRRAASASPALPAKEAEMLIGTPSESDRSSPGDFSPPSPSPSVSSDGHEPCPDVSKAPAQAQPGAGVPHHAGHQHTSLEVHVMMGSSSISVTIDDESESDGAGEEEEDASRPQTQSHGDYVPWKSTEMKPSSSAASATAKNTDDEAATDGTEMKPSSSPASATAKKTDDEADADGTAEVAFVDAEFPDDDDPDDTDYKPEDDEGDDDDDDDDESDEDADEEDAADGADDDADQADDASGPGNPKDVLRVTEMITIQNDAGGPGSGDLDAASSASSASHEANYTSQPLSATGHLWARDSKFGELRSEALAHERAQSGYGGAGAGINGGSNSNSNSSRRRDRTGTFDLPSIFGVAGLANDGLVRHMRAAAATAMESDNPIVSNSLSPFSNSGSFEQSSNKAADKRAAAAAAAAAAAVDKAETAVPPCLPASHHVVTDIGELGQFLASASYVVSLGGRPLEDLKYGVILVPEGEEEVLFGSIPGKTDAESVGEAMFCEAVAEKSAEVKRVLHEQHHSKSGTVAGGQAGLEAGSEHRHVVEGHVIGGENELVQLDGVLEEIRAEDEDKGKGEEQVSV